MKGPGTGPGKLVGYVDTHTPSRSSKGKKPHARQDCTWEPDLKEASSGAQKSRTVLSTWCDYLLDTHFLTDSELAAYDWSDT